MFAYHLNRTGCPNKTDLICDFQTYLLSTYTQACKKYEDFEVFVAANKKKQHTVLTASIGSILGHLL